jgi:hypothetical protein
MLSVIVGCEKKTVNYEYLMHREGQIEFWREEMYYEGTDYEERGDFLVKDIEGDTLMNGMYDKGFKIGQWNYNSTDTNNFKIWWDKYSNDERQFYINYPKAWTIIKSEKLLFQSTFTTKSIIKNDKYFIVIPQNKNELEISLFDYWEIVKDKTLANDSVNTVLHRKFHQADNDFYFSTYSLLRNNEEMVLFNFLGESDSIIYDVTYSCLKSDLDIKYTTFLDMIRSMRIGNSRVFSPYNHATEIIDLDITEDPRINI